MHCTEGQQTAHRYSAKIPRWIIVLAIHLSRRLLKRWNVQNWRYRSHLSDPPRRSERIKNWYPSFAAWFASRFTRSNVSNKPDGPFSTGYVTSISLLFHPRYFVSLITSRSSNDSIGCGKNNLFTCNSFGSKMLLSGPIGQSIDITIFSRNGSMGGFVTWTMLRLRRRKRQYYRNIVK